MSLYVKIKINYKADIPYELVGRVFAVLRREYTADGIVYHLCNDDGKLVVKLHEKHIERIG